MTTIIELNKTFKVDLRPIEDALELRHPDNHADAKLKGQLKTDAGHPHAELIRASRQFSNDLDSLTAQDNERRAEVMADLVNKGKIPTPEDITQMKNAFSARHTEFEKNLKELHTKQYHSFEDALEHDATLSFHKKSTLLSQLKQAQQTQMEGLKRRANEDQEYLTNFRDIRNRAAAAEHVLRGLQDKAKAMVTPYRFGPWAAIKKLVLTHTNPKEAERYDEPEEIAIRIAEKSGSSMQRVVPKTPGSKEWILDEKNTNEAEEKRLGARKKGGNAIDWPAIALDYFEGRDSLLFMDAPSAGVFPQFLPIQLTNLLKITRPTALQINLNTTILPNAKKNITATDGAVTCTLPGHIFSSLGGGTTSYVISTLNILAHIYMAKGWQGVELGYETPEEYWDEAYLACRRAGFPHEEIVFRGKVMTKADIIQKGNAARKKIDDVYEEKQSGGTRLTDAIQKLAIPINDLDPRVDRQQFFSVGAADRLGVYAKGSLQQRAAILADYAFNETQIATYIGEAVPAATAGSSQEKAEILELMYNGKNLADFSFDGNPDRMFAAFQTLGAQKAAVFKLLNYPQAAYVLARSDAAQRRALFNGLSAANNKDLLKQKAGILSQPHLPDAVIYELFKGTPADQNQRVALWEELAKSPVANAKALGAIVVGRFIEGTPEAYQGPNGTLVRDDAVMVLLQALENMSDVEQKAVMEAVYEALPSGRRAPHIVGAVQNDNFSTMLSDYASTERGFVGLVQQPYNEVIRVAAGAPPKNKPSDAAIEDAKIKLHADRATLDAAGQVAFDNALTLFYGISDPNQAADALLKSSPADRIKKLDNLVQYANVPARQANVIAVLKALGPNVVGKIFSGFAAPRRPVLAHLIAAADDASARKFLANVLAIYFTADPVNNYASNMSNASLVKIIPHINDAALIEKIIALQTPVEVAVLIDAVKDNPVQQMKILMSASNREAAFKELLPVDQRFKQQRDLFHCLKPDEQKRHIQTFLVDLRGADPGKKQTAANQVIAFLSHPLLNPAEVSALKLVLGADLKTVLQSASTPSTKFLVDYFNDLTGGPADTDVTSAARTSLSGAFTTMMTRAAGFARGEAEAKANYLDKVAQAIAQLPSKKRDALFKELAATVDPDSQFVRSFTLVHLASSNNVAAAKALFNTVPETEKPNLRTQIKKFVDPAPTDVPPKPAFPFRKELYEVLGEAVPPPAQRPAGPPGAPVHHG